MDKSEFREARREFNRAAWRIADKLAGKRKGGTRRTYEDVRGVLSRFLQEGLIAEADFNRLDLDWFMEAVKGKRDPALDHWLINFT